MCDIRSCKGGMYIFESVVIQIRCFFVHYHTFSRSSFYLGERRTLFTYSLQSFLLFFFQKKCQKIFHVGSVE